MSWSDQVLKVILHQPSSAQHIADQTGFSPAVIEFCLDSLTEAGLIYAETEDDFGSEVRRYYPNLGWWYSKPWNRT